MKTEVRRGFKQELGSNERCTEEGCGISRRGLVVDDETWERLMGV